MSGIVITDVVKTFGAVRALGGASLSVAPGEFVSLVGPSGCGKTTLMRIVAGLEAADQGRVEIADRDVTPLRAADRDVAMVFQNYALYPHLTARQNMATPLVMRRLTTAQRLPVVGRLMPGTRARLAEIAAEVERTADLLSILHLLERRPSQLSGGQRQRVALGRAIVRHPKAFLMDEPLSNLDAALRVQTRREIVELHRRVGASTLYVTHDQAEAMTMSDRVAVMMAGEILQVADPETIYVDPADVRVASFVGSPRINVLNAEAGEDGLVRVAGTPIGLATSRRGPIVFAVRPEHLKIAACGGLAATIEHSEFLGEAALLHLRHGATGETIVMRLDPSDRPSVSRGATLHLIPEPGRAFLFGSDGRRIPAHVASGELREAALG